MSSRLPIWIVLVPAPPELARPAVLGMWTADDADPPAEGVLAFHAGSGGYSAVSTMDPMLTEADHELGVWLSAGYRKPVYALRPHDVYEDAVEGIDEFRDGRPTGIRAGDPYDFAEGLGVRLPRPDWTTEG
ncbi:hypothetical protein [Kutzneria sp. NPDC052558]|uniref:hypothetical protein n=1 Tax=Kutzneria sp. NPDC052558 TaxID=3364121 RepID=UPI0037C9F69D